MKSSEVRRPPPTILVADDDDAIRNSIVEFLEYEGYVVASASNGFEALVEIERMVPDVLLLDMRMPVLDGWNVARALKERAVVIPIVVLTAARDPHNWAAEIGAAGVLAKPFNLDDLLDVVQRLTFSPGS